MKTPELAVCMNCQEHHSTVLYPGEQHRAMMDRSVCPHEAPQESQALRPGS